MNSPFDNPILTPALNPETNEVFWLGHVGQGVEDAQPMSQQHRIDFFQLVSEGKLHPSVTRYVYAVRQNLTIFDRTREF